MKSEGNKYKRYFNSLLPKNKTKDKGFGLSYDLHNENPSMYEVYLVDSGETPKDFMMEILHKFFHKDEKFGNEILDLVFSGKAGICGIYTRDVAETKVLQVTEYVYGKGYLLECAMQKRRKNVVEKP